MQTSLPFSIAFHCHKSSPQKRTPDADRVQMHHGGHGCRHVQCITTLRKGGGPPGKYITYPTKREVRNIIFKITLNSGDMLVPCKGNPIILLGGGCFDHQSYSRVWILRDNINLWRYCNYSQSLTRPRFRTSHWLWGVVLFLLKPFPKQFHHYRMPSWQLQDRNFAWTPDGKVCLRSCVNSKTLW